MTRNQILQYSWSQLDEAIARILPSLQTLGIQSVAGISAGIIPATIIANRVHANLQLLAPDHLLGFQCAYSSLLLVTDLDGSHLLSSIVSKLSFHNAVSRPNYQSTLLIHTLSVHVQENAKFVPDFVLEPEISKSVWVKYPWE